MHHLAPIFPASPGLLHRLRRLMVNPVLQRVTLSPGQYALRLGSYMGGRYDAKRFGGIWSKNHQLFENAIVR